MFIQFLSLGIEGWGDEAGLVTQSFQILHVYFDMITSSHFYGFSAYPLG